MPDPLSKLAGPRKLQDGWSPEPQVDARPAPPAEVRAPSPRSKPPRPGAIARFLRGGSHAEGDADAERYPWRRVLWLTGVDYFSTLGYQPGIAFLAAGLLSPLATGFLILVTLAGALPTYMAVARRSHIGQGSIAMLERLLPGWWGKTFVLVLLGFATTDFIITITLSAADAAQHAVENPLLHPWLGDARMTLTLAMLALLAAVFLRGFREAIGLAALVGIPYVALNVIVLVRGVWEIATHPGLLSNYSAALALKGDMTGLLIASGLIFPKLALGMSGFETGVSVMPLIQGIGVPEGASPAQEIEGRVRATRRLLAAAALIMSVMLVGSSLTTTVLIPAHEFASGGKANGRALAFLAHSMLGHGFGTVYDFVTILILWFAGASAMAGLLNLVPRYLPRFGMAPQWVLHHRPLILILFGIAVVVTLVFRADVDAQGGAYATGVLVLMLSAAVAVALAHWREARAGAEGQPRRFPWASLYFWAVTGVFAFTLVDNVIERPDGVIIASIFVFLVLTTSALSRFLRATELRVEKLAFVDIASAQLWDTIKGKKINLIPLRTATAQARRAKAAEIRRYYNTTGPLAFLHIELRDDRSEFSTALRVKVEPEDNDGNLLITVSGAVAIANTIAYVSEQVDPIALFLGLTLSNKMTQAIKYLVLGEGEVGVLVYEILVRYWESTPEDDVRPLIFLMSE